MPSTALVAPVTAREARFLLSGSKYFWNVLLPVMLASGACVTCCNCCAMIAFGSPLATPCLIISCGSRLPPLYRASAPGIHAGPPPPPKRISPTPLGAHPASSLVVCHHEGSWTGSVGFSGGVGATAASADLWIGTENSLPRIGILKVLACWG